MSELITLPAPVVETIGPPRTKWQSEFDEFRRLLPRLLSTHRGSYVAIHLGQVVEAGDEKLIVALRALSKVDNVDVYVGLVTEEPRLMSRSGLRRNVPPAGDQIRYLEIVP